VAQVSAHGRPVPCTLHATATFGQPGEHGAHGQHGERGEPDGPDASADGGMEIRFDDPQRPVAPGQTVALYDALDPDAVVGAGIAA
jgi:hypothetical protein